MHGPSWYLEDVEVLAPSGDSLTFVVSGDEEHWLDAKRGDKKIHRVLHPEGEQSTRAANAATAPTSTISDDVAMTLETERQRARLAEEESARARADAERAKQQALRKVEEAEARAAAAEMNAKQVLLEQLTGSFGLNMPSA